MEISLVKLKRSISNKLKSKYRQFIIKCLYIFKQKRVNNKETILFWNPGGGGWPSLFDLEGVIASSLKLRGHEIHAIIFDQSYYAYTNRDIKNGLENNKSKTDSFKYSRECVLKAKEFGIEYTLFGDYLCESEKNDAYQIASDISYESLESFNFDGISIGPNIKSSIIRYLKGKDYTNDDIYILKEYTYAAILNTIVIKKVIKKVKPSKAFMSHAIYVDWGPAMKALISKNIPTTTYASGYKVGTFYFKNITKPELIEVIGCETSTWNSAKESPLLEAEIKEVDSFFYKRYYKNNCDDIKFDLNRTSSISDFKNRYNLDKEIRPIWGVFSHINWDASRDYAPQIYENYNVWMEKTIESIINFDNVIWLIKIHPCESLNPSKYTLTERLKNIDLPDHIKIIPAYENLNPQLFQEMIDGGVTTVGTIGLEMALIGKPIILAGQAHYSGKGFTIDCRDHSDYIIQLKNADKLSNLSQKQVNNAYKYAHLILFRKQIRLPILYRKNSSSWNIQTSKILDVIPNREKNISFICNSFLSNNDYALKSPQYLD